MKFWVMASLFVCALGTASKEDVPGACRVDDERFHTEEGGCVQFSSGLVWSAQPTGKFSLKSATAYCETLEEGERKDWRLPKRGELQALASSEGALDHLTLKRVAFFWAGQSTSVTDAWAVSLADGEVAQLPAVEASPSLVCVRTPEDVDGDGVPDSSDRCNLTPSKDRRSADNRKLHTTGQWKGCAPGDSFIAAAEVKKIGCAVESPYFQSEAGGCKHVSTGLVWSARSAVSLTPEYASAYCADLSEGLKDDWRLPSADELRRLAGALQGARVFKFDVRDGFWSTSQTSSRTPQGGYNYFSSYAVSVQLPHGAISQDLLRTEKHYCCPDKGAEGVSYGRPTSRAVMCVRSGG